MKIVSFSEAVTLLKNGEYKEMRQYLGQVPSLIRCGADYIGPFINFVDGNLTQKKPWQGELVDEPIVPTVDMICGQWAMIKPVPKPEDYGFQHCFVNKDWKKSEIARVWINVYYDYNTHKKVEHIYNSKEMADRDANDIDMWTFISQRHLSQQYSIPWKEPK